MSPGAISAWIPVLRDLIGLFQSIRERRKRARMAAEPAKQAEANRKALERRKREAGKDWAK